MMEERDIKDTDLILKKSYLKIMRLKLKILDFFDC